MSNLIKFNNNAKTTVSTQLLAGGTTLTVGTGDGAQFDTVASPDTMYLTLENTNGDIEIVQVTSHALNADSFTIVRAQEGTTAIQWEVGDTVELRLTSGILNTFAQFDFGGDAKGSNSINLQTGRSANYSVASGNRAIAIGYSSRSSGIDAISIGYNSKASYNEAIAIGKSTNTAGNRAISIGTNAYSGINSISIGYYSQAQASYSVAIGYRANNTNSSSKATAIGYKSKSTVNEVNCIGANCYGNITKTTNFTYPIIVKDNGYSPAVDGYGGANTDRVKLFSGSEVVIATEGIDLTALSNTQITLPTNFFISEVGIIANDISVLTVQPTFSVGTTSGGTDILAATLTTALTATGKRESITSVLLKDTAITDIYFNVTAAATATSAKGRFYVKGFLIGLSIANAGGGGGGGG